MSNTQNSSSDVQQTAEKELLANFEAKHKVQKSSFVFSDGFPVKIDGIYENPDGKLLLVEAYAHQGPLKSAQTHKICTDMLKLITAQKLLFSRHKEAELWILLACEEAEKHFKGKSWHSFVVKHFGINIEVGKLNPRMIEKIRQAQIRQKMVNAK